MAACCAFYAVSNGLVISEMHDFLTTLISFTSPGASYYVVLYVQLVLVTPLVYVLVHECVESRFPIMAVIALLISSLLIGYFFTIRGIQLPYFGGAKYLLCGSFLFLFTLGMVWAALDVPQKILQLGIGNILAPISALAALLQCLQGKWIVKPFDSWALNPPGLVLMWYAISMVWCIAAVVLHMERIDWVKKWILQPVSIIGRYSMDIFLFHNVVHILASTYIPMAVSGSMRRAMLFVLPIIIPMVGRKSYLELKKWVAIKLEIENK